jgi:hypothetical protein
MFVTELDSFLLKFHQLWSAGQSAHLDLETHAGNAWVGLRVQLGHVPGPPHHQFHPPFPQYNKQVSPSRQRRRARRSAAQQASKVTTEEETVEETVLNENDKKKRNLEARNDKET